MQNNPCLIDEEEYLELLREAREQVTNKYGYLTRRNPGYKKVFVDGAAWSRWWRHHQILWSLREEYEETP